MNDAEQLILEWTQSRFPEARACTETPAKMENVVPVIQVVRVGGSDYLNLDNPMMSFDVFDADRDAARKLADLLRDAIKYELPGAPLGGGQAVVSKSKTISGPSWRPYVNTGLRRIGATYQLWLKDS